ncbi:MAG: transcription elongation factor GreA [Candidatus Vogelbacteria bacterium]|nr:transcription elongation factor GreA [Candidatus Vogelbacteria bacterium]
MQYLSIEKFDELRDELNYLKTIERKKNAESLEYAKSLGDLSENAEYHEAREHQADVEDRIVELENILKNSEIVSSHHSSQVEVGVTVITKRDGRDNEQFMLVGAEEADMSVGKISYESPIGSALLGHKKGDMVAVSTPKGEIKYTIVDIK